MPSTSTPWFLMLAIGIATSPSAGAAASYVDSRLCSTCHAQIADAYRKTGMGRSFFRPSMADTSTNAVFDHERSDTHYSMISRGGALYQRRWQVGFEGEEINVEDAKVDYILGSGDHARSYLHRTSRGTLIELPLGWYAEKGGSWAMSPGFDSVHPATRRLVSYECMFCHNAYPQVPAANQFAGSEPVFTGDLPQGIDCQRCHGPGSDHVAAARTAGSSAEKIRATIVNPKRLDNRLRMDLCMQCHLEPTSTRLPSLVRRFDRAPFSFVAGQPLAGFLLAFDHAAGSGHDDKFEIVGSSAYRLRKSRCFLESRDALTCDTCHDPHPVTAVDDPLARATRACRVCHASELDRLISNSRHTATTDCANCHLPKRRTEDVVHVIMTDHLIQRHPPSRDLLADLAERHPTEEEEYHGEVVPYYAATDVLYRALAQVAQKNNLHVGVVELAGLLEKQHPREPEWYLQLGDAWLGDESAEKATSAYQQAIRLAPRATQGQQSLAEALKATGQMQRAAEVLRRAIRTTPEEPRSWYQLATIDFALGRPTDALASLERAIAQDPDLPGAYTTLASIAAAAGQRKRAADARLSTF